MKKTMILLTFIILLIIPYSCASNDFAYNRLFDGVSIVNNLNDIGNVNIINGLNQQVILYNETTGEWYNSFLNDSAHHVNASDYWLTNIGSLSDVNATQLENNGGTLSIIMSWFDSKWESLWDTKDTDDLPEGSLNLYDNQSWNKSLGDDLYVNIAGDNMTGSLGMGSNNITDILSTQYNIAGCSDDTAGTFCYDTDSDTMRFVTTSGQVLQMNQETTMPAKNLEGSNVLDGSIVYIMGATGANPNFKLAKADNLSTAGLLGVVTKDCNNNQVCPVVFFALVHDFNTSSFVAGDHLYLSDTEAGNFTTTPPLFPNVPIWVATVIRVHPTEGNIFVFPRLDSANGITMNDLGLVGDLIQTDYKIISVEGNAAIGQNVFTIQMNGTSGIDIPHLVLQPGGAGQASAWVRSGMVVPESVLCLNNTNRTNPTCFADEAGFTWRILDFNTNVTEGADWGITGELEVVKSVYVHENITLGDSIKDSDTDSRVGFNESGTWVGWS